MKFGLFSFSFVPPVSFNTLRDHLFMTTMHNRSNRQPPSRDVQMNRPSFKPTPSNQGRKTRFYAVRTGRDGFRGILNSWDDCKRYVYGVSNAVYKSFKSMSEAQEYIRSNGGVSTTYSAPKPSSTSDPERSLGAYTIAVANPMQESSQTPARNSKGPTTRRTSTTSTTTNTSRSSPISTRQSNSTTLRHNTPATTAVNAPRSTLTAPPPRNPIKPVQRPNTSTNSTNPPPSTSRASPARAHSAKAGKNSGSVHSNLFAPTCARDLYADSPVVTNEAPKELDVYTDGACSKNGGRNARAGYGVYFGLNNPYNISAPLKDIPTNQRAEMTAVLEAMKVTLAHGLVANGGKLTIYTDSQYTKNGVMTWMQTWKQNGWKNSYGGAVKNKEIWLALDACHEALAMKSIKVSLNWVKSHSGIHGNEMADMLAVSGMNL